MTAETTARPETDEPDRPARFRLPAHAVEVGMLTAVATAVYSLLGLTKLANFRATTFDLVIVDQAVRAYAKFAPPYIPTVGMVHGRGMDYLQVADHFSPIYALLAPLYWIHDGPASLIIGQALLFAGAIPFLWMFTRRVLGTGPAYLVSIAYALSWPVAQAVNFDAHEVMFVPILTAIMIERFHAGRLLPAGLAMFGLLFVKEDMGLLVIGAGACVFVLGRRLIGLGCILLGAGWAVMLRGWLMPLFGGDIQDFWAYAHFGPSVGSTVAAMLSDPINTLSVLFSEETKIDTMFLLAWPALMLCFLSPMVLMALPLVLERMLADRVLWWAADYQYNAFVVMILFCAGVDGAARLLKWLKLQDDRALKFGYGAAVCAVAITLLPQFAFGQLVRSDFYSKDARVFAAAEVVSKVPSGVVVETVNSLGPAVTDRTTVLMWGNTPYNSPWVVADVARWEYPFGSVDEQRARVDDLLRNGYRKVFEREGFILLNR
ncbi:DUF2079 domain-containing protein [Sinosporangium siamense]|uniref:DUF2079 domain-containing protein n=1 Tax=Sinosporangium siamense TaxID=1367973 RepID=A0A919V6Y2_9ACTN|nr:DUF2079 domain-containing protein [Sinosporangium siamense]GII91502.1 hypothetical protein Ssi02_17330 [Sinosporangium siamense]